MYTVNHSHLFHFQPPVPHTFLLSHATEHSVLPLDSSNSLFFPTIWHIFKELSRRMLLCHAKVRHRLYFQFPRRIIFVYNLNMSHSTQMLYTSKIDTHLCSFLFFSSRFLTDSLSELGDFCHYASIFHGKYIGFISSFF